MLDKVLATISILALVCFMSVVVTFVNEPDLWIVVIVVLCMAIFDFIREFRNANKDKSRNES